MQTNGIGMSESSPVLGRRGKPSGSLTAKDRSFKNVCADYLKDVNSLQKEAGHMAEKVATGEVDNLHEIAIALNEADLSFRLMMQVRNKLVAAYEEIMRMRV